MQSGPRGKPDIDDLNRIIRAGISIGGLVRVAESGVHADRVRQIVRVQRGAIGNGNCQFEILPDITGVNHQLQMPSLFRSLFKFETIRQRVPTSLAASRRSSAIPLSSRPNRRLATKSSFRSETSRPCAQTIPGAAGTTISSMPRLTATSRACNGPAPPNGISTKSRGSMAAFDGNGPNCPHHIGNDDTKYAVRGSVPVDVNPS